MAIERGAYAYNPFVQHQIAQMYLELDAASATLDRFVGDWVAGTDHGEAWVPKVYSMKWRSVEAAKRVVDTALDVSGGQRRPHPRTGGQGRTRHPHRAAPVVIWIARPPMTVSLG